MPILLHQSVSHQFVSHQFVLIVAALVPALGVLIGRRRTLVAAAALSRRPAIPAVQFVQSSSSLRTIHAGYSRWEPPSRQGVRHCSWGAVIAFVLGMSLWWFTLVSVLPGQARKPRLAVTA